MGGPNEDATRMYIHIPYVCIHTYVYMWIGDTLSVDTSFEGQLNTPIGCAVDGQNCLYVSEWGAHRIRRIQPDGSSVVCLGSNQRGLLGPKKKI